jgi:hypothetical protein
VRSFWFGPEQIEILASALDAVLRTVRLDRDDPATQVIAKKIIDLACLGELDPVRLRDHALEINQPTWERKHVDRLFATLKADQSSPFPGPRSLGRRIELECAVEATLTEG